MGRARLFSPCFGSREPQSAAICYFSCCVILVCSVNLPCGEGFGFAPSVLLFSLFILEDVALPCPLWDCDVQRYMMMMSAA